MKQTIASTFNDGGSLRRVYGLLTAAGILLLLAIASAFLTFGSVNEDTDAVEHTMQVQSVISRMAAQNERIETARRGYLIRPDAEFIEMLRVSQKQVDRYEKTLTDLVTDNPAQLQRLKRIGEQNDIRRAVIESNLLTPVSDLESLRAEPLSKEPGTKATREIRALSQQMMANEEQLLSTRNRRQLDSLLNFYFVGGLSILLLLVIMVTVVVLVLRFNRDLTRAQVELQQANDGLEQAVAARTAELTRANGEIQRFAYIVSHDLRSPLVNVLGFTSELESARKTLKAYFEKLDADHPELKNEQAWLAVDEDLPEAVGFIRTSTEKMDRLINSILDLSRQGRRQLSPELLDMNALAQGVVDSMHQRVEDSDADVTVGALPPLESDRVAVEQILSNLVENALKYLSPGRKGEISVTGKERGKNVLIDVTDNGRGIAPADLERVFELFRRAGTQDQAGEGIGLANVRALAYRLGGTVDLESELGKGSRFRLTLPKKFVFVEIVG